MRNNLGTKVEKPINVPKTISGLKKKLTAVEKQKIAKHKKVSYRMVNYILAEKRKDTINILRAGQRIIAGRAK